MHAETCVGFCIIILVLNSLRSKYKFTCLDKFEQNFPVLNFVKFLQRFMVCIMRQDKQRVRQPDDRSGRQVELQQALHSAENASVVTFWGYIIQHTKEGCVDILGLGIRLKQLPSFYLVRIPKRNLNSNVIYCFDSSQISLFLNSRV